MAMANDLQAGVVRRHPRIGAAAAALLAAGAEAAAMSGSGSAVFGVFAKRPSLKQLAPIARLGGQVFATRTLSRADAARRMGL